MLTLKIICSLVLLLGLSLLYRYLPNRRIFAIFCVILAAAAGITYLSFRPNEEPGAIMQRRYEIQQQQVIFAAWYEEYQQRIDQLDNNWQQYHNILENFKEDNISIQTAYVRLTQLEIKSSQLCGKISFLMPPIELDSANYDLTIAVIEKTKAYANAQHDAIQRTRNAADPSLLATDDQEQQSRMLQDTMIRYSPPMLFTAEEIGALRDNLTLPKE